MTYNFKDDMTPKPLKEQRWHWKSVLVYVVTLMYAIDILIQPIIFDDTWAAFWSFVLVVLLGIESFFRLKKKKTWIGAKAAPALSAILIIALSLLYITILI